MGKKNIKLSFVIPAYNEEAYIGKCLASIVKQVGGRSDTEIIVVNNASTDGTKETAASFRNVKVVDEPEKGIVKARRAGFLASRGELIANIDADTVLTPGWVDKVVSEFSKNPKLVAVSGPYIYYDLPKSTNFAVKCFYAAGYVSYLLNRFVFRVGSMLQGGNFVVKRSAIEKIGGYNTKLDFYGEDSDLARRLHKVGDVKFTFGLPMYTSGRRLKGEGVLTMGMKYGINYFWTIFFKKPFTKSYIDVREDKKQL